MHGLCSGPCIGYAYGDPDVYKYIDINIIMISLHKADKKKERSLTLLNRCRAVRS